MTLTAQDVATQIRDGTSNNDVEAVMGAVNKLTTSKQMNGATVIVACAQILAQTITSAHPDITAEIRLAIIALIDGFAMEFAVSEEL